MVSLALLALVTGLAAAGPEKDPIHIVGVGQHDTLACDGRDVMIEGTEHILTLTGACNSLNLTGADNKITIELKPGAAVMVAGTGQTVRWRSARPPLVRVNGVDNHVSKAP